MADGANLNADEIQRRQRTYRTISPASNEDSLELHFDDPRLFSELLGQQDGHIRTIEQALGVRIGVNGSALKISGAHEEQALAGKLLGELYDLLKRGYPIYSGDVEYSIRILRADRDAELKDIFLDQVYISAHKRIISPKSLNQKAYVEAIRRHDIVFGIGPAGTGKTYLAMAMALAALMKNQVTRMVLCRPAVEAGEKLGFLPGDLAEKVNPYLRPLYDALHDMLDAEDVARLTEKGVIEIAPLAYMRGRTLSRAFIVLDEAQNTTSEQMMMFLTRLGEESRMVVTGDVTQVDLPRSKQSGLIEVRHILEDIAGIDFHTFSGADVVRHPLVQRIIDAYEAYRNPDTSEDTPEKQ